VVQRRVFFYVLADRTIFHKSNSCVLSEAFVVMDRALDSTSKMGYFDPLESNINFAVQSRNDLYKNQEKLEQFYPGINDSAVDYLHPLRRKFRKTSSR
jgi:hypothetical protein